MLPGDRSDKNNSRQFFKQAVECGVISGLAVVLSVLNILPPAEIYYRVDSEVVVAASQLPALERKILAQQANSQIEGHEDVMLTDLRILDRASHVESGSADNADDVALVELSSVWSAKCTDQRLEAWLEAVTRFQPTGAEDSEVAREKRYASWELKAAEHYVKRHEFLTARGPAEVRSAEQRPESNGQRIPTKLASYSAPAHPEGLSEEQVRHQLMKTVAVKKQAAAATGDAWQQHLKNSQESVQLAGQPKIAIRAKRIAPATVFSIFALGAFSACIAGWFQGRLHTGGVHLPDVVASALAQQGLPVAGQVTLASIEAGGAGWTERTSRWSAFARRYVGPNLTRAAEVVIGFWLCMMLGRLLMDPMWRSALLDSPLTGIARLLTGMP